jgi:GNAT superfamily N-acetyltransferase
MAAVIRPMEPRDVYGVHELSATAFADLNARMGDDPEPPQSFDDAAPRIRHLLATDPGGAWVAESDDTVIGAALALVRDAVWGLSLLVVHPAAQSAGLGRELLARARSHGDGARGFIILASRDARALRAYIKLGLDLHPAVTATGRARGVPPPAGLRAFEPGDREWVDGVGRAVRGAGHANDLDVLVGNEATVAVLPERGYAAWRDGSLKVLAATDEVAARTLLRGHLAAAGDGRARVAWLTSRQQWAIRECLDAGLHLDSADGGVLTAGEVGTFHPYLPSGAYL